LADEATVAWLALVALVALVALAVVAWEPCQMVVSPCASSGWAAGKAPGAPELAGACATATDQDENKQHAQSGEPVEQLRDGRSLLARILSPLHHVLRARHLARREKPSQNRGTGAAGSAQPNQNNTGQPGPCVSRTPGDSTRQSASVLERLESHCCSSSRTQSHTAAHRPSGTASASPMTSG